MIYLEGMESIIEAIYLNEKLDNRNITCNLFVNPENVKYLTGKNIIINSVDYSSENINQLLKNNCKIISRVSLEDFPDIEVQPYILRINFNIMWNGKTLDEFVGFQDIIDNDYFDFSLKDYILYFPKIKNGSKLIESSDKYNNLSCLGWALQQVGENIKLDTPFTNLDIIKTKKIIF